MATEIDQLRSENARLMKMLGQGGSMNLADITPQQLQDIVAKALADAESVGYKRYVTHDGETLHDPPSDPVQIAFEVYPGGRIIHWGHSRLDSSRL